MISTEMDKTRDVRRGTSRFSRQHIRNKQQQSRTKLLFGCDVGDAGNCNGNGNGGDFVRLEKVNKEKLRRLSSVNGSIGSHSLYPNSNQHCETEMGSCCRCDISGNGENQCPSHSKHSSLITNSTTKGFKIPKKFFADCDALDQASVPRKLRSAMKKRGRESFSPPSPDSEKLDHTLGGVESRIKDGLKKPKLNLKQGESDCSRKLTVCGPITKDEEEVVETLYALARMFPESDSMDKNKLNGESIKVKSSASPNTLESPVTAFEVKKEDTNSICCQQTTEIVHPSTIDESSNDAAIINSLSESTTTRDQHDLSGSQKSHMDAHLSSSEMRLNATIPFLAKSEPGPEKSSSVPGNSSILSDLSLGKGFKQQVTTLSERRPEMAFGVTTVESPVANGLGLWPGLSSTVPLGAQSSGSSQSSAATKIPAWLGAAISGPRPCSLEGGSLTEKVSKVAIDRKRLKRCGAHVYISCLIRNLQMQNSKEDAFQPSLELKPQAGLKRTAPLDLNNGSKLRNKINGTIPICSANNSGTDGNFYEVRSAILQQKMLHQDQSQVASASGMHTDTSQRQSIDFLSLSAGGISKEANNGTKKAGNGIERLPQLQDPLLHSLQHQSLMPFTIPSSRYTSSTCTDQFSAATVAQQIQLQPQYFSNPFCGPPYTSHSLAAKQQQQQRLWAAQYRPGGSSAVLTQFPSWQNGTPESTMVLSCAPTIIPSHSTLDVVGNKYNAVQQHQPMVAISSSLPSTRAKRQDPRLPLLYEENISGFRGDQLQLLCNERL